MLALAAHSAGAHEYYFQRDGDALALYQGHVQSQHAGEAAVRYDPAVVQDALCVSADGQARSLPLPRTYPARFADQCAALRVQTSTGYWSQTRDGDVNRPKTDVAQATYSWWSEESIKYVARWLPALAAPFGGGLELVPLENPLVIESGEKLRLRVTWRGEPLAGAPVAYDGELRGVTDTAGEINVRLRHGGRQLIAASFEEGLVDDARADAAVRTTALQFQIAE